MTNIVRAYLTGPVHSSALLLQTQQKTPSAEYALASYDKSTKNEQPLQVFSVFFVVFVEAHMRKATSWVDEYRWGSAHNVKAEPLARWAFKKNRFTLLISVCSYMGYAIGTVTLAVYLTNGSTLFAVMDLLFFFVLDCCLNWLCQNRLKLGKAIVDELWSSPIPNAAFCPTTSGTLLHTVQSKTWPWIDRPSRSKRDWRPVATRFYRR